MKVISLGAGVLGVTTACHLARAGVEARVLDRQPGPGMETSFANAGEFSYGLTSPWAAPRRMWSSAASPRSTWMA